MECNEETESLNKRQNKIKLKLKNSRILKKKSLRDMSHKIEEIISRRQGRAIGSFRRGNVK